MSHILSGAHNTSVCHSNLYSIGRDQHMTTFVTNESWSSIGPVQERRDIADWLSSLDFKVSQSEFLQKRTNGTGRWLLESKGFKDWRDGMSETLWCSGPPGVGKTVLASIVVNHLQTLFKGDNVAVVCIYCNYKEQSEQTVGNFIASLLKQIVQDRSSTPGHIKSFFENHHVRNTRPTLDEFAKVLNAELAMFSKTFIILDALDECPEDNGTRAQLLRALEALAGTVNLMVTSRSLPSIAREFQNTKRVNICANDEDVKRYIAGRIVFAPRHLKILQETIENTIVENVKGMFLLAQLHMDSLVGKLSTAQVREALNKLPKAVDDTYDEAMERIDRQDKDRKELANRVLSWITSAFRPLSVKELQHALAVEFNATKIDPEAIIDKDILMSVCAGLVVIDKRNTVRLVHCTTQQYLERKREIRFPNAQVDITKTCLTYLSFDTCRKGGCNSDRELDRLLRRNPFLHYAARYWGHHARGQVETICMDMVINLLLDNLQVTLISRVLSVDLPRKYRIQKDLSAVHLSSFFGLQQILKHQVETGADPDSKDNNGRTPLMLAVEHAHEGVVRWLLAREDVDANSKDKFNRTPLWWAAKNGLKEVARLLLAEDKVDVNSQDRYSRAPLLWAAEEGHEEVVRLLLARDDVDVNSKDRIGLTPLSCAAGRGHKEIVKLLLARDDVDVNSKDRIGHTPLRRAADKGHEDVVQLLLARDDVDVNSGYRIGQPLLSWAGQTLL